MWYHQDSDDFFIQRCIMYDINILAGPEKTRTSPPPSQYMES